MKTKILNSLQKSLILELSASSINRFFEDLTAQRINCKVLQNGPQGPVTTQNTSKRSFEFFKPSAVSVNLNPIFVANFLMIVVDVFQPKWSVAST